MLEENKTVSTEKKIKKDYLLPASVLIAAVLVSVSLIYNAGKNDRKITANIPENNFAPTPSPVNVKAVSSDDHILGNPAALVKIIEFSDLECPYCKKFHPIMKQVLAYYGDKVAWIYRHLPLDDPDPYGEVLHSKAGKAAEASECAAELGGNEKFWAFVDRYFEVTPSNDRIDLAVLPKIATDIGLDRAKFESCFASGRYAAKVKAYKEDAKNSGARGTPYSLVIAKNGQKYVIPGALPFESNNSSTPSVKLIIEEALK